MTGVALALVLAAAFLHATWNLLAKRSGGGAAFVWLFTGLAAVLYTPAAIGILVWSHPRVGVAELGFMAGSAVLHLAYFLLLQKGYSVGDLSLVYPLARGTGPTLSTAAAILFFGERPGLIALAGALLVSGGVFALASGPRRLQGPSTGAAVGYGLLTGLLIAAYTLWDKHAVSALFIPPLLLDWAANLGRAALLTPIALRRWEAVRAAWQAHRREAVGVAVLSSLAYILVLTALRVTPVSYVAPAREVSILIGTLMGARLLAEGDALRRLAAASALVLGVVALATG